MLACGRAHQARHNEVVIPAYTVTEPTSEPNAQTYGDNGNS